MAKPDLGGPDCAPGPSLGDFSAEKHVSASLARDGGSRPEFFAIATRRTPSGLRQGGPWG